MFLLVAGWHWQLVQGRLLRLRDQTREIDKASVTPGEKKSLVAEVYELSRM